MIRIKYIIFKVKEFLDLLLFVSIFPLFIALGVWLSYKINENYRTICESNNGTYIEEFYGIAKGRCIYDKD